MVVSKEMAQAICNAARERKKEPVHNYYLMNISHPIMLALKLEYCKAHGINNSYPMSDEERINFECSILSEEAKAMLPELIARDEEFRKTWGHVI